MTVTLTIPKAPVKQAVDYDRLLAAIQAVEGHSWTDEGGALAFTRDAWDESAWVPYTQAKRKKVAFDVARWRLSKHEKLMAAAGIEITPESLATAWRHGLTGAIRRKGKSDYGRRCSNLFFDK